MENTYFFSIGIEIKKKWNSFKKMLQELLIIIKKDAKDRHKICVCPMLCLWWRM